MPTQKNDDLICECDKLTFDPEELSRLQNEFHLFDKDNSGNLDASEVQQMIKQATRQNPPLSEVEYVMSQVDTNHNQVLEFNEFLDMVKIVKVIDQQMLEQFNFFDADSDGYIEYKELKAGLKELNQRLSKSKIKLMMNEADLNKDGKVSLFEFSEILFAGQKNN